MEGGTVSKNFIEQIIDKDIEEGRCDEVVTRFPPEPNGYLHIGHAKSILLNYGLAEEYHGKFHMRFDDTNPTKEKVEFVESIKADIQWLGADWGDSLFFASDYFEQMYEAAVKLIKKGKAYVSDLSADEIREYRGTLTEPGKDDPSCDRSVEENLALFEDMKNGKFKDGEKVLRAKIDMASPNINMPATSSAHILWKPTTGASRWTQPVTSSTTRRETPSATTTMAFPTGRKRTAPACGRTSGKSTGKTAGKTISGNSSLWCSGRSAMPWRSASAGSRTSWRSTITTNWRSWIPPTERRRRYEMLRRPYPDGQSE